MKSIGIDHIQLSELSVYYQNGITEERGSIRALMVAVQTWLPTEDALNKVIVEQVELWHQ